MADPSPESKTPAEKSRSSLADLSGDAGCVVLGIPLVVAGASIYIFMIAANSGAPWAGAAAVMALSFMAIGVVWVLARGRA